jgi:hypothetical protein
MPIEDVFSIEGRGTVVTGKIEQGIIKVGEEIEIVGLKDTVKTTVTGVEMFNKQLQEGMAGDKDDDGDVESEAEDEGLADTEGLADGEALIEGLAARKFS